MAKFNPLKYLAKTFANAYSSEQPQGLFEIMKKMLDKIKFWAIITVLAWVTFGIIFLFHCSKPEGGLKTCIHSSQNGLDNSFTYNLKESVAGGNCSSDIYNDVGQKIDWIDTGFETTGEPLIVYVSGRYFPWGETQATKTFGYHLGTTQNAEGDFIDTLDISEEPQECLLNTSLTYTNSDDEPTRLIYENQLNVYTSWNANNRTADHSKILLDKLVQADCIDGNNCNLGTKDENPIGCVLENGAGIYMRIGNNAEFAYHIINHSIPKLKHDCTGSTCKYTYDKSGTKFNMMRIPFGLPTIVYDHNVKVSSFIKDIRGKISKNLVPITEYTYPTDYQFTTIVKADQNDPNAGEHCINAGYQKIGNTCYKSITKKFTPQELQEHICVPSGTTEILMPDELCKPQKGKRIWIKPSDTCYDDNEGSITLTFASGAKNRVPKFQFENHGFKVSWIQQILLKVLTPFWGKQSDDQPIEEVTGVEIPKNTFNTLIIQHEDENAELYYTKNNGNYMVKLSKYDQSGILLKDNNGNKTGTILTAGYGGEGGLNKSKVVFTLKSGTNTTINDIDVSYVNFATTLLVKINDMNNGMFVKVRNAIMTSSMYHIARILFVVWFVFSFGLGFINKEKVLTIKLMTADWKKFFILMWFTDPDNYGLLDDLLWPALFSGSQRIAAGILDAASGVWGTSLTAEDPMSFFDEVVSMMTSKELIYKLGAVATTPCVFYMFFLLFPLLVSNCIDLIFIVMGPIISVMFTMFSIGQIIMLLPIYALISLFGINSGMLTATIKKLISDFVHFAFALGFFGMMIGFIYHYFVDIIDVEICWENRYKTNWFIYPLSFDDWQFKGSPTEQIKTVWGMIKKTFSFMMVVGIIGKIIKIIPEYLANVFAKGGGQFGLQAAQGISDSISARVQDLIDKAHESLKDKEKDEEAQQGKKGILNDDEDDSDDDDDDGKNKEKLNEFEPRPGVDTNNSTKNNKKDNKEEADDNEGQEEKNDDNDNPDKDDTKDDNKDNDNKDDDKNDKEEEEDRAGGSKTERQQLAQADESGNNNEIVGSMSSVKDNNESNNNNAIALQQSNNSLTSSAIIPQIGGLSKDDFNVNLKRKHLPGTDGEDIIHKQNIIRHKIIHHKRQNDNVDDANNSSGAMLNDSLRDAGIQDGLQKAGIEDNLQQSLIQDTADKAFVQNTFAEQKDNDAFVKEQQQKEQAERIEKDDKVIQKSKSTMKNVTEKQIDINKEINKISTEIKTLLKDKNLNEEGEKAVKDLLSERVKLEKQNTILFRQKQSAENKMKIAKRDKFNQNKKKND